MRAPDAHLLWALLLVGASLAAAVSGCSDGGDGALEALAPRFEDTAEAAGFLAEGSAPGGCERCLVAGGLAAEDVDGDGDVDLVMTRFEPRADLLYLNRGDGTFEEAGAWAGIDAKAGEPAGVLLTDLDGDGAVDLLVGGTFTSGRDPRTPDPSIDSPHPMAYRGLGDGRFEPVPDAAGLGGLIASTSWAAADVDGDGALDLAVTRYASFERPRGTLWRGAAGAPLGSGSFEDATFDWLPELVSPDYSQQTGFTPTLCDVDDDGDQDLLIVQDFGDTAAWRREEGSDGGPDFAALPGPPFDDDNGMGAVVEDLDGDGDMDWFVTSIHWPGREGAYPDVGATGNRLYWGDGDGAFVDGTDLAGVRDGHWGWGACAADFDLDGALDLFHTTGNRSALEPEVQAAFRDGRPRLFVNREGGVHGRFRDRATEAGLDDGRGGVASAAVCVDVDGDGDVDVVTMHHEGRPRLWTNRLMEDGGDGAARHWLTVRVDGPAGNRFGVGARVTIEADGRRQVREIRAGGAYLGHGPAEVHVGLGHADRVDRVEVRFPNGVLREQLGVAANQRLRLRYDAVTP